jgi:hypothetical protein
METSTAFKLLDLKVLLENLPKELPIPFNPESSDYAEFKDLDASLVKTSSSLVVTGRESLGDDSESDEESDTNDPASNLNPGSELGDDEFEVDEDIDLSASVLTQILKAAPGSTKDTAPSTLQTEE